MSKIDLLLSFVDEMTARSGRIVESIRESDALIHSINSINTAIASADSQIDTFDGLFLRNREYLNELDRLQRRTFFLESTMPLNDRVTNQTCYDNLHAEFQYLMGRLNQHIVEKHEDVDYHDDTAETEDEVVTPVNSLKNLILISDLRLKPIRCRSAKVEKKKSRYRLSSAYNIIPVAGEELTSLHTPRDSNLGHSYSENTISPPMSILETNSASTTPENDGVGSKRADSAEKSPSKSDPLRRSHFVDNDEMDSVRGSPTFRPLNADVSLRSFDIDDLSDVSDLSSEWNGEELDTFDILDNFDQFLRQLRLDLSRALPIVTHARSQAQKVVFHNPVDSIQKATTAPIALSLAPERAQSALFTLPALPVGNTTAYLTLVMEKGPVLQLVSTPKRFPFFDLLGLPTPSKTSENRPRRQSLDLIGQLLTSSFLQLVNSPVVAPPIQSQSVPRLVTLPSPPPRIKELKKRSKKDPILAQNDLYTKRLPPQMEIRPRRRDGAHSNLIIGPNRTRIISHGEQSVFRKPLASKVSQGSLREALANSMVDLLA